MAKKKLGGVKNDQKKCRMELIPAEALIAEGWGWTAGAEKYDDWNWQKGFPYTKLLGAAQRHLNAIKKGQLIDPETQLPHAALIRCSMGMLLWYEAQGADNPSVNDLPKERADEPFWAKTEKD